MAQGSKSQGQRHPEESGIFGLESQVEVERGAALAHMSCPGSVVPWQVEKICQRLTEEWKQPPLLALLLPTAASDEALMALDSLSERGVLNLG